MQIINLTPHPVVLNGKTIESTGLARVREVRTQTCELAGIPVYETIYTDITDLPPETHNTIYIVSIIVALSSDRTDLYTPGDLLRDDEGRVIGCQGIQRVLGFVNNKNG